MLRASLFSILYLVFINLSIGQMCTPIVDPASGFGLNCYYDFSNPQIPAHVVIAQNQGGCHIQNSQTSFTFMNTEITIHGHAHFDFNVTFDNVTIYMTEGSSITVDAIPYLYGDLGDLPNEINNSIPANNFRLINQSEIKACDKMWEGIKSETQENKAGPAIYIEDSTIRDAYMAIQTSDRGNHYLDNSDFIDNYIAIESRLFRRLKINGCTFKGENGLRPPYSGLNLDSNTSKYGINSGYIRSLSSALYDILPSQNTFENLQVGIRNGFFPTHAQRLVIEDQVFNNVTIAIQTRNVDRLDINRNTINFNNIGVDVVSTRPNAIIKIGNLGTNDFKCTSSSYGYASVAISDSPDLNLLEVKNNVMEGSGNVVCGMILNNVNASTLEVRGNDIIDSFLGISLNNVRNLGSGGFNLHDNTIRIAANEVFRGIYGIGVDNIAFIENTIVDLNTSGDSYNGINLAGNSSNNLLTGNIISAIDMNNAIHLQQSSMNNLCCNITDGQERGLHIEGANTTTQVRGTEFKANNLRLTQSRIGRQEHNGNRWKGANTTGVLNSADITQAAANNQFIINASQSNPTDGLIKPAIFDPANIESAWFPNDPLNSSNINCINPSVSNCNFPINPPVPPTTNQNFTPSNCGPGDMDTDGDGVCDSTDPAPEDACVPISLDTDGDGICDGIDPDPNDGCIPLSKDTDGDGVCDGVDVDVLNPCLPNGTDNDQDGVCADFDPDDSDANVPVQPVAIPAVEKDLKNRYYATQSVVDGVPLRSLEQIRAILSGTYGTHAYELVNEWEDQFNLVRFLMENQYYVGISDDLTNFWNNRTNNAEVWEYVRVYMNIRAYKSLNTTDKKSYILNDLYQQRILQMTAHYEAIGDQVVVDALDDSYNTLTKINDNIIDDYHAENTPIYNQLSSDITALNEYEVFHTIMKQVMRYELKNTDTGLDQNDLNTLSTIAYLCPLSHGAGVYMAQALLLEYNALDLNLVDNNCDTNFPAPRNAQEDFTAFEAEVYPNPSTGIFHINAEIPVDEFIIYKDGKIIQASKQTNIADLSKYPSGVYQMKIITDEGVSIKKIVKVE